jgi:TPP-dependent pyruvate/acetoin dehydrogenase alpha subunit
MHGHSSSDDPSKYRSDEEVARWAARDPIDRFETWLVSQDILTAGDRKQLEERFLLGLDAIIHEQEAAAPMALKTLVDDVYGEVPVHLKQQYNRFIEVAERLGLAQPGDGAFPL